MNPPGDWTPVTHGESGAHVFRSADGQRYAKCAPIDQLAPERDRVAWLGTTGIPGPTVLDWQVGEDGACLVTSAVRGVPADSAPASALTRAWPSISAAVRALLPAGMPVQSAAVPDVRGGRGCRRRARSTRSSCRWNLDAGRQRFYLHLDPLTWG